MSIIYEALQKAQKQRESKYSAPLIANIDYSVLFIRAFIFVVLLAVLSGIGYGLSHFIPNRQAPKPVPAILAIPKPIIRIVKVKLNGVFLSNEEKIAMINQQMYRLGDDVYGMKIVHIELDKVLLKNAKQTLELRTT